MILGNTRILLVNNPADLRNVSGQGQTNYSTERIKIADIARSYPLGKTFWGLGYDTEQGLFSPVAINHPRITFLDAQVVTIRASRTTDGNSQPLIFNCLPEVKFLLADNQYIRATELEPGQILMDGSVAKTDNPAEGYLIIDDLETESGRADVYTFTVPRMHNLVLDGGAVIQDSFAKLPSSALL